jgi:hypothetical protein
MPVIRCKEKCHSLNLKMSCRLIAWDIGKA